MPEFAIKSAKGTRKGIEVMTLEEIDNSLPQGLHDAQIRSFVRDMESASLKLLVKAVVGTTQENKYRLQYRDGEICFHNVQYFMSEFPEATSIFRDSGCVNFSFDRTEAGAIPSALDKVLSSEILKYSLFVLEWQACIHIAAQDVSFRWSL